jgi:hypothetical protein
MDIYNLGAVQSTTDGREGYYGFNIVGVHSRPLVTFSFDTQEEAEAAHKAMQASVAKAKVITPHPPPYPR